MRLPRQSLLLLLLLTTLCLLVGVVFGIKTETITIKPLQASPTAPRATMAPVAPQLPADTPAPFVQPNVSTQQMALLIVGVSDKNALQPKLEGCWIVAFSTGINEYYVVSFPPETRLQLASLGADQPLADIYVMDVQQEVGYRFMRDAVQSVLPGMTIQTVVTLDRSDMVDLASKLGGVAIAGQVLEGAALAAAYDTQSLSGAAARNDFQHQAFQSIFNALRDQHWTPQSIAAYLEGLPHAVRPEDAAALPELANNAPPLQATEMTWKVVGGDREATPAP